MRKIGKECQRILKKLEKNLEINLRLWEPTSSLKMKFGLKMVTKEVTLV